jgi:prephenate dehydratase
MRVAYPGLPGAFSHEACLRFLPEYEPVQCESFEKVIGAVASGNSEIGILPIANNAAGDTGASELIDRMPVRIAKVQELPVRMHLLGVPGGRIEDVRKIISHPVALRQCVRTLQGLGLPTEEAPNTAVAAAGLNDASCAVLGSEAAARIYGLSVLVRDVHDRPDNATSFAIIERDGA